MTGLLSGGVLNIVLLALVIILFILVISLSMRLNRLTRKYRQFMRGSDGSSLEKSLAQKVRTMERIQERQEVNADVMKSIRRQYQRTLSKYGIVKYDAFEDVGGKMSFALAMLDMDNNGFVLNVIHSRDNCYMYLKEIVKGESYIMLSDEEIQALRQAAHMGEEEI